MSITRLKIRTGWRRTSWLFTSVDEKLNSGLPRTASASGQNGISTRDLRISNPALQPLGHAATLRFWLHIDKSRLQGIPRSFYGNYPTNSLSWDFIIYPYRIWFVKKKIETTTRGTNSMHMPFLVFQRSHLRFGIICSLNFHETKKINNYTLVMPEQITHKVKTENNTKWVSSGKKKRARVPNPLGVLHEKQQCSLDP